MAEQEDGWPLGLRPLNTRVGLFRSRDFSGSISFSTLATGSSSSSSLSSSDFDTESTGSFFHDRSITLGNLIGVTNILRLSRRSVRDREPRVLHGKNYKPKMWFSLCAKACANRDSPASTPSLGQFLEVERRAANSHRMTQNPIDYEFNESPASRSASEHYSLFSNGRIAPPRTGVAGSVVLSTGAREQDRLLGHRNGRRHSIDLPIQLPCMCGQPTN